MRLFHGSLTEVKVPRILETKHIGDFGCGFYTTTDIEQARKFVTLKCLKNQMTQGVVSCFEAPDALLERQGLRILVFKNADEAWVNFVEANRRKADYQHDFDLVYGPVANDQVFTSFTLYENELINMEELIKRLKVRKLTDQLLFHTEKSLSLLKYIESEVVLCSQK